VDGGSVPRRADGRDVVLTPCDPPRSHGGGAAARGVPSPRSARASSSPRWATVLAGETLALYVVHLLVLFAEGVGPGRVWAHALSLEASLVLALAMLAGSVAVALGWARVWPPLEARWMPWLRAPRSTLPPDARAAKNGA
jgi:hypothetical protein